MTMSPLSFGGDERIRTADPHVANVVLSQLSYIPLATLYPTCQKITSTCAAFLDT